MAVPTFIGVGAGASTETSGAAHNLVCPATVNAGELLIAHLWYEGTTVAPTTPGGWTLLDGPRVQAGNAGRMWVYGRKADGTEDGTTINFGSPANANARHGRIYSFSSVRDDVVTSMVGGFGFNAGATSTTVDDQPVTTVEADSLAVNLISINDDNATVSFTGETGGDWVEPTAEYVTAATTPDACLQLQRASMASVGTITGGSFTMASDAWMVVGFYIRGVIAAPSPAPPSYKRNRVVISDAVHRASRH